MKQEYQIIAHHGRIVSEFEVEGEDESECEMEAEERKSNFIDGLSLQAGEITEEKKEEEKETK